MNNVLFSSISENWETPKYLYDSLNKEFHFNLDPCSDSLNHKCDFYFTKEQNGLNQDWEGYTVFCNPPYGRHIGKWVEKAYNESLKDNTIVVMLLPSRTDTQWFHNFILGKSEIRFLKGRLCFGNGSGRAPFPNIVVVFDKRKNAGGLING